jgi:hypothetical protein
MGTSNAGCEQARGQLALQAIGRLPENERLALQSHLDGCADCRAELVDLSGIETALRSAEPERVDDVEIVPESLRTAVLGALHTEAVRHKRSTRVRVAAAAAVLVIFVGGATAAVTALASSHHNQNGPTFALSGPAGAHGTVQLTAEPWGTSVELHAVGGTAGQVLTVSMRTADGSWWQAGTYQSDAAHEVDVPMSCAVPARQIDGIRITTASGEEILSTYNA